MGLFSRGSQQKVGIDIGTSSIKAVELKQEGSHLVLQNYAVTYGLDFLQHIADSPTDHTTFKMAEDEIAAILKKLLSFAGIKTDRAIFSIPIFSSFLTVIEMPYMDMEELEKAVSLQVSSYIPVPINEVVLDWLAIPPTKLPSDMAAEKDTAKKGEDAQKEKEEAIREALSKNSEDTTDKGKLQDGTPKSKHADPEHISVLLIAIPREVINYYERIAQLAGLKVEAVESESFSMMRSLLGNEPGVIMLVDLGARSSTLTIVDQGFIRASHTVDLSGKELTDNLAKSLNVATERAEELKRRQGLKGGPNAESIQQVLSPTLGKLLIEYRKMADYYKEKEDRAIEKIVLTGGSSDMPGLKDYIQEKMGVPTVRANPFARIKHKDELEDILSGELAPHLAVAAGAAMRDLE